MTQLVSVTPAGATAVSSARPDESPARCGLCICRNFAWFERLSEAAVSCGCAIESVGDADTALRALAQHPHHLVMIDPSLPRLDARKLIDTIAQRWAWIRFIVLVDEADAEEFESGVRSCPGIELLSHAASMEQTRSTLQRALLPQRQAGLDPPMSLEQVERRYILTALTRHRGNRAAAAEELGISVRKLYYRLRIYQREGVVPVFRSV